MLKVHCVAAGDEFKCFDAGSHKEKLPVCEDDWIHSRAKLALLKTRKAWTPITSKMHKE